MEIIKSHKAFNGEVQFCQHASKVTNTAMNFSMFIPKGPIKGGLLWLSGLTCNEENFITKAGALSFLNEHGLCLVCPDTSPRGLSLPHEHDDWDFGSGASFYVNATTQGYNQHYLMQDYLIHELLPLMRKIVGLDLLISISGHSMGGHGALYLGLTFPDLFTSISAFSPIVNPMACPWGQKAFTGYLGTDRSSWQTYDSCELVRASHKHSRAILISQGLDDPFLETELLSSHFETACKENNQALQLEYHEGFDHSYYFIASFIKQHVEFHTKCQILSHAYNQRCKAG